MFDQVIVRIAGRFGRVEPRAIDRAYGWGLLWEVERKCCRWRAERAGLFGGQKIRERPAFGCGAGTSRRRLGHRERAFRPADRFTATTLERFARDRAHAAAAKALEGELVQGQVSFVLDAGECPIANQRRIVHGREALHSGQDMVLMAERRLPVQLSWRAGQCSAAWPAGRPRSARV
ncbi:hypothetical protein [Streptomyces sp. NPDC085529]|uniref:hypothetical protein n=1 Tax=Streptomyces sp. NPDC085529 TaxID=3365729 RepID=UPI0037CDA1E4